MWYALRVALLMGLVSQAPAQAPGDLPSFVYTAAPRYEPAAWSHGGERFPEGAHLILVTGQTRRNLVPDFFATADAAVSFDGLRILFAGRPARSDSWQIWEIGLAGGTPRRLSAGAGACVRPLYLPGGGIVYTRMKSGDSEIDAVSPAGKADVLTHAPGWYLTGDVLRDGRILFEWNDDLFTVYPDGTGVESLRCDHGPHRAGGRQISSGDVVFGVERGMARFTSALAVQQTLPQIGSQVIAPVAEIAPDRWLAAARARSGGVYAIHQVSLASRSLEPIESPRGVNAVEPVFVAPRVPPREFPSALVPARTTGNLLCLDVKEARPLIDGKIHSVRVYTRDDGGSSRVLGQTSVASDGSFYVEVPADRPLRMELLDAAGTRLRGEDRWFWMRPSEQRICVGCHAGPERAPENRVPQILNEILSPVKMLGETRSHR